MRDRRVWAELGTSLPDGIAVDAEGPVWFADPASAACVRVAEGGRELQRVAIGDPSFACALGGPDRTTLFVLTSAGTDVTHNRTHQPGRIATVPVDVPGAGTPRPLSDGRPPRRARG